MQIIDFYPKNRRIFKHAHVTWACALRHVCQICFLQPITKENNNNKNKINRKVTEMWNQSVNQRRITIEELSIN